MRPQAPEPTEYRRRRFDLKVDKSGECWLWTGATNSKGYGSLGAGPRGELVTYLAHRVAYVWAHGPIPDGWHIDHICSERRCVNPDHLEAVAPAENSDRAVFRLRWHTTVLAARQNPRLARFAPPAPTRDLAEAS